MEQHPLTTHEATRFNVERAMLRTHAHYGADGEAYYGGRGDRLSPLVQATWKNEARQLIMDFGVCLAALPPDEAALLMEDMRQVAVAAVGGPAPAVRVSGDQVAVIQPGGDDDDVYRDHPEALATDALGVDAAAALARHEARQSKRSA